MPLLCEMGSSSGKTAVQLRPQANGQSCYLAACVSGANCVSLFCMGWRGSQNRDRCGPSPQEACSLTRVGAASQGITRAGTIWTATQRTFRALESGYGGYAAASETRPLPWREPELLPPEHSLWLAVHEALCRVNTYAGT